MKTLFVPLVCIALTSVTFAAVEPIDSHGMGALQHIQFLPDGTILRVKSDRIEIADVENDAIIARFAEQLKPIGQVTVSSDGRHAAIRTGKTAELWDVVARQKLHQLDAPFVVAFSRTDPILAMNNRDPQITLWSLKTGELLGRLDDRRGSISPCYRRSGEGWSSRSCSHGFPFVFSMAFSPDGRFLVVGSKRPDAEVWDFETRQLVGHLEGHSGWVTNIAYSPNGRWIATSEPESTKVYLWNAQTQQLVRTWHNGAIGRSYRVGEVFQLFFSPNSLSLYVVTRTSYPASTNTYNDRVRVLDVETGRLVNEFRGEPTALKHVSVSPDGSRAILQYHDQVAVLWDIKQNRRIRLWADNTARGTRLDLSPDGSSVVQIYPTLIKIWDVPSRLLRGIVFQGEQSYRLTLAMSPDSRRFATGLYTNGTEVRDMETGKLHVHIPDAAGWAPIVFNQRGDRIATRHRSRKQLIIVDVDRPQHHQLLEAVETETTRSVRQIAFSEDDRYVVAVFTADDSHRIHLWKREKNRYSYRYVWRPPIVTRNHFHLDDLAFHPHATPPILVRAAFGSVVAWKLAEQAAEQIFQIDGKGPLHFSKDGHYLFLNGKDGLQIWDWQSNALLERPTVPPYLTLSDDTLVLLTQDNETGQFQIWNGTALLPTKPVVVELGGKRVITLGGLKRNALLQNFPNPFNPETWIPYRLENENTVTINIYNHAGTLVRTLPFDMKPAGDYTSRENAAYWDGRNATGEPVASGVYFYTLTAGGFTETRMMTIQK